MVMGLTGALKFGLGITALTKLAVYQAGHPELMMIQILQ